MASHGEDIFTFKCNLCWEVINSTSYKASCHHIFCEGCAFQHFGQSQTCPACGRVLAEGDFTEFIVGMQGCNIEQSVLQDVLQEPAWEASLARAVKVLRLGQSVVEFALTQLFLTQQRNLQSTGSFQSEMEQLKRETSKQIVQLKSDLAAAQQKVKQLELRLTARDREFSDLQTAYREKARKCTAWEKAYASLRGHSDSGAAVGTGLVTPPLGASPHHSGSRQLREHLLPPQGLRTPTTSPGFRLSGAVGAVGGRSPSPSPRLTRDNQVYRGPIASFRSSPRSSNEAARRGGSGSAPLLSRTVRAAGTSGVGHFTTTNVERVGSPLVRRSLGGRPSTPFLNLGRR